MSSEWVNVEKFENAGDQERLAKLTAKFSTCFDGKKVEFFCRAPGRVNLIGEHIDYCGYGVLPMAVSQDILMAVAKNDEAKIRLVNMADKYVPYETSVEKIEISQSQPKWFHYFLCGFKGVMERIQADEKASPSKTQGMDVLVDGCVPSCAGLSSSSALVCASALATMVAYVSATAFTKLGLAELCQHCEKYIGTEGGGMDQSIAFLAQEGKAKFVEFNPLRVADVTLPAGVAFVIANSCVQLNKAATSHFNTRVAECRLAAQVLASKEGVEWRGVRRLLEVQEALELSVQQCCDLVCKHLTQDVYTKEEVCALLAVSEEELNSVSLSSKTFDVKEFKLRQRAFHVFSESQRVLKFKALCEKITKGGDGEGRGVDEGEVEEELGELMNESHSSCRDAYECSCGELDELVQFARANGALGSRLTGAGWGGCCVSMVSLSGKQALIDRLKGYYEAKGMTPCAIDQALFATVPSKGASIIYL